MRCEQQHLTRLKGYGGTWPFLVTATISQASQGAENWHDQEGLYSQDRELHRHRREINLAWSRQQL